MNIPCLPSRFRGLVLLLLPCLSIAAPIEWLPPDLNKVQLQAQAEDKLFILYFTAEWCAPCQWMQDHTFQDAELRDHLRKNVLSVRVDLNHPQAKVLQHRFEVEAIPTILIFATNGQLIDRKTASIEAKPLLRWLKRIDRPAYHVKATLPEPQEEKALDAPRPQLGFSRPALVPDAEASPALSEVAEPSGPGLVLTGAPIAAAQPGFAPRSGLRYGVKLQADPVDYTTAVRAVRDLERKYEQTVQLFPAEAGKFHLVLGGFATTGEARTFLRFLQRNDRQGEIIPLSD